jgi:hypothetical protein
MVKADEGQDKGTAWSRRGSASVTNSRKERTRIRAAVGVRRIVSSLAWCIRSPGANSITSFCSNDSLGELGRPQLHCPSLACRVF